MKRKLFILIFCLCCSISLTAQTENADLPLPKSQQEQDRKWQIAIAGGVNISTLKITPDIEEKTKIRYKPDVEVDYKYKIGFRFGVTVDRRIAKNFYIQPALFGSLKRMEGKYSNYNSNAGANQNEIKTFNDKSDLWYVEMPINLVCRIPVSSNVKVAIHAGPYFAVGLKSKYNFTYHYYDKMEGIENTFSAAGVDLFKESDYFYYDHFTQKKVIGGKMSTLSRFDAGISMGLALDINQVTISAAFDLGLNNYGNPGKKTNYEQFNRSFQLFLAYRLY